MLPIRSRPALRNAIRAARPGQARPQLRFESTQPTPASSNTPAILGGVAGGTGVLFLGYLWYHFSGAKTAIQTSNQAHAYVKSITEKVKSSAPSSGSKDALQWFRDTAHSYTGMIPGAATYIDTAFDDVEKIRDKHGDEVDKILSEAKDRLVDVVDKPVSFERVAEVWTIISDSLRKITHLAGDSMEDIIENHPWLKEKVGPKINELKQMGEQYGPEAKKVVDDTWKEAQGVLAGGFSMATVSKIQDLIQRKSEELKKYADQAWEKGMEQVKPMLDKQPELKEQIEKNKDALLKGDLGKLWEQVKKASESGNVEDLKKYVQDQISSKGTDVRQYADQAWDKAMEQLKPIFDKKPELREQIEKNKDALLTGDVKDLWDQIRKAAETENTEKLQKFIQEQLKEYKGYADQLWEKGMEQAKPVLDRVPELKERIEKNKDKLKKIDLDELWKQVKKAGEIGNTAPLEKYLKEQLK